MEEIKSSLSFRRYCVSKINFEYNDKCDWERNIEINFELDHDCSIIDDKMILKLYLTVFPDAEKNNYPFTMDICLQGEFEIKGDMDPRMQANAIAILYPYARAIVTNYTAQANFPSLILPPINVYKYLDFKNKGIPSI